MSEQRYKTFSEFWPFYLAEHSRPGTRWFHLIGTLIGLAVVVYFIAIGRWWLFPLGFMPGLRLCLVRPLFNREEQTCDL